MSRENNLTVVTKDDLIILEQRIDAKIEKTVQREIDKNNSKLISKIEETIINPLMNQVNRIGSLVCYRDVNKKWVSKQIKEYLGIRVIKESRKEYNLIVECYKAKLRIDTGITITRLEDIPQTPENLMLLKDVCEFMYPERHSKQRTLF